MDLYFSSAEQPQYLDFLLECGVKRIAVSYYEWIRRHDNDRLPRDLDILITPGISKKTTVDFKEIAEGFCEFAELYAERAIVYDIDSSECPPKIRRDVRAHLQTLANTVVFPSDQETLEELSHEFSRLGVNARISKSMSPAELRRIQVSLYGSNVMDLSRLRAGRFVATATMAWLSPRRYGELWVFSGARLFHHSAEHLVPAVRRHRAAIEALGCDPERCSANDTDELTRLAVLSMAAAAESVSRRPRDREAAAASLDVQSLDHVDPGNTRDAVSGVIEVQRPQERPGRILPVIELKSAADGSKAILSPSSARLCDTCSLSGSCPEFEPSATCKFDFPVEIRTREQMESAVQVLLETQFGRAMFRHWADQLEGGIPSSATGAEIDRWFRILKEVKEINQIDPKPPETGVLSAALEKMEQQDGKVKRQTEEDIEDAEVLDEDVGWVADEQGGPTLTGREVQ